VGRNRRGVAQTKGVGSEVRHAAVAQRPIQRVVPVKGAATTSAY
jgi:hypothetical protein